MDDGSNNPSTVVPGGFKAGYDPRRNPGGRQTSKVSECLRAIETIRDPLDVQKVLCSLRDMAANPEEKGAVRVAAACAWLDRMIGPVKPLIDEEDLRNAPPEVLRWLSRDN